MKLTTFTPTAEEWADQYGPEHDRHVYTPSEDVRYTPADAAGKPKPRPVTRPPYPKPRPRPAAERADRELVKLTKGRVTWTFLRTGDVVRVVRSAAGGGRLKVVGVAAARRIYLKLRKRGYGRG